jgi:hypothetical protein
MFRKEEIKKLTVHKDPQINAKILKLYGKALKQFPNSPAQLKTSAEINRLLRMPAPQTDKDKLKAKSVDQLKRQAKKVGAKLVTPEGKAKTKDQLINSIIMKERLSGKSDSQTGKSNTAKDLQRSAKAPGKRTSAKGTTYYERRANRSDKPGSLLGENFKYRYISADTWRKTPNDYKTVINGVKYKMFLDETRGTILAPVKIKKS